MQSHGSVDCLWTSPTPPEAHPGLQSHYCTAFFIPYPEPVQYPAFILAYSKHMCQLHAFYCTCSVPRKQQENIDLPFTTHFPPT